MTEAAYSRAHAPALALARPDVPPRSLARQVLSSVLKQMRARSGLIWIGVLAVCAVWAPMIANSHPILMKRGGVISSPLLRHLTPSDVILQAAFWVAIVLWFVRIRVLTKAMVFGAAIVLASVLS